MKYLGVFLGEYEICPNSVKIKVDCYGNNYPAQMQTLEQEGFNAYAELERVEHNGYDITDYLHDNIIDELTAKINEK